MQDAAIDLAYSALLVFVFGTVAWVRRPDDRARCWFAGWFMVLGSCGAHLGEFYAAGWHRIAASAGTVDLMALAGIYFVVSSAIPVRGRRSGVLVGATVAIPTLLCLSLTILPVQNRWILLAAVAARQTPLIATSWSMRRLRPRFAEMLAALCAANAVLLAVLIVHGSLHWIAPIIVGEVFFAAGMDTWNRSIGTTFGSRVTAFGLMAWGAVFPLAEMMHKTSPQISAESDIWNPAKACVAVGMMLIVFEEQVRTARALAGDYRLLFDHNPNPVWIYDTESLHFLAANEAACTLHGYTKHEFLRLRLPDILHPDVREHVLFEAKLPKSTQNRASRHVRKDGSEFPMDVTAHTAVFQGKNCRFVLGLDVTKRHNLERRLEYQQAHDALSGLSNRRSFEEQLTYAVALTVESGRKLAIVCLDICHFKRLNEIYGPGIGDKCVQYVASVLSEHTRMDDLVARTGDDEFAIVLTRLKDLAFAEEMTARIQESFKMPVLIGECEVQISFSMGVAVCPDDSTDGMGLWHLAENALRRAQAKGSGQILWISPELRADAEKRKEIAAGMNRLLEEDRFCLVYQPVFAADGAMGAMEALLRLDHPRHGPVDPLTVIRIAEENEMVEALGQWIFEKVCRQIQMWMDHGVRLVPVAINVSSMQMMRRGFAERLLETMERYSVDPRWIHLEITETAAMENLKAVSGEMMALSALGSTFSIDDFGTGYSSLGRLHRLPISILKVDRSFVEHLCDGEGGEASRTIVQAILSMAHALGMRVVAEGVETERQLNCLLRLGCDLYQGFLLSRPVEPEKIPSLLAHAHPAFRSATEQARSSAHRESPQEEPLSAERLSVIK